MKSKTYTMSAKVWRWPGTAGWHFVATDSSIFYEIRQSFGKGMVPITLTLKGAELTATLFPHLKTESYLLAIKKSWRKQLDIYDGDELTLTFSVVTE